MTDKDKAKLLLQNGHHTCVLCKNDIVYVSDKDGIMPMIDFIGKNYELKDFSVADKIVGRAAAMLFIKVGIKCVYAQIISTSAVELLTKNGIECEWDTQVEHIINRKGTGLCPMEIAVKDVEDDDFDGAYYRILQKLGELNKILHKY